MDKEKIVKQFQVIPGIGKACSLDLWTTKKQTKKNKL